MSSQIRLLIAAFLVVLLGGILTISVALKSPSAKWSKIERQILNDLAQKIIDKSDVSADEERIAADNKYKNLKGQAFARLSSKKTDEALALLTWIRERTDEDPQVDYYLAQAWQLKEEPENASKYYRKVVEKSGSLSEIATALEYLRKNGDKTYVEAVHDFIVQQNKDARFSELLEVNKKSFPYAYGDDKTFILLLGICAVEGDQPALVSVMSKSVKRYLNSEILKPYLTTVDGGVSLDIVRLGDDLAGKDNPQRKEAVKISVETAVNLAKELKK